MERRDFIGKAPGDLIQIEINNEIDYAFLPYRLPKEFDLNEELIQKLIDAREELARLDGMGRSMPHYELLLKPIQRREAIKSSSLEGTIVQPEDLILYEIGDRDTETQKDKLDEKKEVLNYIKALRYGQELLNDIPISLRLIRELHNVLMRGVRGNEKDPGNFRRIQVQLGSDRRFLPPPPQYIMHHLDLLEKDIHADHDIDNLLYCFMIHYQFEAIHPFTDGNGRVGRLLLSLMIYNMFEHRQPWLYLSSFFDKYKDEYISKLYNISAKNDWKSWLSFCLQATKEQAKDSFNKLSKLVELRNKYFEMVSSRRQKARINKIVDELFVLPVINVPRVKKMLNVTYPTARRDVDFLLELGILKPAWEDIYPQHFAAPEILQIVYYE
jgi:Fic family protein